MPTAWLKQQNKNTLPSYKKCGCIFTHRNRIFLKGFLLYKLCHSCMSYISGQSRTVLQKVASCSSYTSAYIFYPRYIATENFLLSRLTFLLKPQSNDVGVVVTTPHCKNVCDTSLEKMMPCYLQALHVMF